MERTGQWLKRELDLGDLTRRGANHCWADINEVSKAGFRERGFELDVVDNALDRPVRDEYLYPIVFLENVHL